MVCTGNLCRSPMAEGLLRAELAARGCSDIEVTSAGTWAGFGYPATPEAVNTVRARGADISAHRSRPLSSDDLKAAELIVAMTSVHVREIESIEPRAASKTILLKHLALIEYEPPASASAAVQRTAVLLQGRRPEVLRAHDVDDPMGLPGAMYERCADYISEGVAALADALCGER